MAFNWPGKKETREPGAKPEFPSAFDTDLPEATIVKGENPLRSAARETAPRVAAGNADVLALLTQRLETLGQMLDETKEQVTSYLLHRESQSSGDDVAKALARKVERAGRSAGAGTRQSRARTEARRAVREDRPVGGRGGPRRFGFCSA